MTARCYGWKDHWDIQPKLMAEFEHWTKEFGSGQRLVLKLACQVCGQTFYCQNHLAQYCSYRCRNDGYMARRKARRLAARQKVCASCGAAFTAKRKDAAYCGPACKQRRYRQSLREKVEALIPQQGTVT